MAIINVNPTRMEMKRLQGRLKTASRGHKLLKDKTDEMIRRFITLAEQNKRLREETERELANALNSFAEAQGSDLFILPSSVNEVILLPVKEDENTAELRRIVRETNEGIVNKEEWLSDEVYYFRRSTGAVELIPE